MSDCAHPTYRATVDGGALFLVPWHPGLSNGGPGQHAVRAVPRSVTLADLTVIGDPPDREVLVAFVGRPGTQAARERFVEWAEDTGHRRVWFPDAVVELDAAAR